LRRAFTAFAVLLLALVSTQVLAAGKKRVRWVRSVYTDAKGVGLKYPEGVACTNSSFVVADTGNSRLIRYTYQDDTVTPVAVLPVAKSSPLKVQLNSEGALYLLDGRDRQILKFSPEGSESTVLKPKGLPFQTEIVPKSFAIDAKDGIYVLDVFSENVVVLDEEGKYQRRIPFPKQYGFFSDVTVDAQGKVFLLDSVAAVVYGAAQGEKQFSQLTKGMKKYMNFPTSITVDSSGLIYLVDQHGSGLALIGQDGEFLGRELGMGWGERGLYYPAQICVNSSMRIFIADRNNNRVQIFRSSEPSSGTGSDATGTGQSAGEGAPQAE
jgi:sugar lactone lactonase YvrE